eukprot:3618445-Lingulodinium_polyedra.AAC.1
MAKQVGPGAPSATGASSSQRRCAGTANCPPRRIDEWGVHPYVSTPARANRAMFPGMRTSMPAPPLAGRSRLP